MESEVKTNYIKIMLHFVHFLIFTSKLRVTQDKFRFRFAQSVTKCVKIKTLAGPDYTYEIIFFFTFCHFIINWCAKFEKDQYLLNSEQK